MLKRVHIKGFKTLTDVEVELGPLVVLFGPNASGKSNLLDAIGLLSRFTASNKLKRAFDPPYRGKPLESFSFGEEGIEGLLAQDKLKFSIEADFRLSDAVVEQVDRLIADELRIKHIDDSVRVQKRNLRYRLDIEMLPRSGRLRVADESLKALTESWTEDSRRRPYIARAGGKLRVCQEGRRHCLDFDRYLDHTILSKDHFAPLHPHLVAAAKEMASWLFFSFEPRERMRSNSSVTVEESAQFGFMGDGLAVFLDSLKANRPMRFSGLEQTIQLMIPSIEGIELGRTHRGEAELRVRDNGACASARVASEGTLRIVGLLALACIDPPPSLVAIEEPENGVHARGIEIVGSFLDCRRRIGCTQYIVTSHSPNLADFLPKDSLRFVTREKGKTRIDSFSSWSSIWRWADDEERPEDFEPSDQRVSERIMQGHFDA